MLAIWLAGAFTMGLVVRQIGLPPLVGFLAAGFLFSATGAEATPLLDELADAGVLLLLFAVGLKLRLQNLFRIEVWGTALLHLAVMAIITGTTLHLLADLPWSVAMILGVALGFSSTVLAAKMLEFRRELRSFHGRVAIGILIVQDLIAVGLLATMGGASPSPWALLVLLALPLMRPILSWLLDQIGHDELLVLFGAVMAIGAGGWLFHLVGLSHELGALALGAVLAEHKRAQELSNAIWSLKEFLLIGFFLSIGLSGLPTVETLLLALVVTALLPIKAILFFFLLLGFGLRARTSYLAALGLASYSEFGLIIAAVATESGLIDAQWLVFAALIVALSFAIGAPLNRYAHHLFEGLEKRLERLERKQRHPDDSPISFGSAEMAVIGMGRAGTGAYDYLRDQGHNVVGIDNDPAKIESHRAEGRKVVFGDLEDPLLSDSVAGGRLRTIMITVPDAEAKRLAARQLRRRGY
ncbi:MAG: cation:proton antiporter, partial [Gammaproteobacteria bacterium]|nr:cation:proton antiporter [Gammaproteobacteria bacterium]